MKKWFYRAGAGIAGVLFVASAMTLVAPKAVHAVANLLVTVTNTPNVSVVNTPNVNIANTVPVTGTVAVSSLPAVVLGGTVSANITNAATNPLPTHAVDDPALQRFQFNNITNGLNFSGGFTVPSNKILVIENLSALCQLTAVGDTTDLRFFTRSNGVFAQYSFAPELVEGGSELVWNSTGRIYADPGSDVSYGTGASIPTSDCDMTISGHFVDLQ